MAVKQRPVVCLDGTWNRQDDSTNVLHHFALSIRESACPNVHEETPSGNAGPVVQRKHYLTGVGTGVLDSVSGGAFGFGLELNVRAAYDWLVENYNDGDDVYIFGFSRGAYTARSLVGFIDTCGLLKRGSPLSIKQLWIDYCVLGRQREQRGGFWDRFEARPKVRRITDLICDPWNVDRFEMYRTRVLEATRERGSSATISSSPRSWHRPAHRDGSGGVNRQWSGVHQGTRPRGVARIGAAATFDRR
jgi:hypothetical protein